MEMLTKLQKGKHWTRFPGQPGKIALYWDFKILEIDGDPLLGHLWNSNMISLDQLTSSGRTAENLCLILSVSS